MANLFTHIPHFALQERTATINNQSALEYGAETFSIDISPPTNFTNNVPIDLGILLPAGLVVNFVVDYIEITEKTGTPSVSLLAIGVANVLIADALQTPFAVGQSGLEHGTVRNNAILPGDTLGVQFANQTQGTFTAIFQVLANEPADLI